MKKKIMRWEGAVALPTLARAIRAIILGDTESPQDSAVPVARDGTGLPVPRGLEYLPDWPSAGPGGMPGATWAAVPIGAWLAEVAPGGHFGHTSRSGHSTLIGVEVTDGAWAVQVWEDQEWSSGVYSEAFKEACRQC